MTFQNTPAKPAKITIGEVAKGGLEGIANNLPEFFKTATAPAIIVALGTALPNIVGPDTGKISLGLLHLAAGLTALVAIVLATSFSVSWQRYLILGESPSAVYFGRGFWSYIGRSLLVAIGFFVITAATTAIIMLAGGARWITSYLQTHGINPSQFHDPAILARYGWPIIAMVCVSILPGCWWLMRQALYFTAGAVGDTNLSWGQAFHLMNGNVLAYVIGGFLDALPVYVPQLFLAFYIAKNGAQFPMFALVVLSIIAQFLAFGWAAVCASIWVRLYDRLVAGRRV